MSNQRRNKNEAQPNGGLSSGSSASEIEATLVHITGAIELAQLRRENRRLRDRLRQAELVAALITEAQKKLTRLLEAALSEIEEGRGYH